MVYQSHKDATEEAEGSKKVVAFKAKEITADASDSENSDNESDDINLLAKRIGRILRRKQGKKFETKRYDTGKFFKDNDKKKEMKEEKKQEIIYYECKKPGHIKY